MTRDKKGLRTLMPDKDPDRRCEVCGRLIYVTWIVNCLSCDMWVKKHVVKI